MTALVYCNVVPRPHPVAVKRVPNARPVRAAKYRNWAMTTWQEMSDHDRWLVGIALGYMTIEEAVA